MAVTQGSFYADLGENIARARRAARMTQDQLALRVGLSRTSITNIERGRQPVQVHLLATLADILGVTFAELIPSNDSPLNLDADRQQWVASVIADAMEV